MGKEWNKKVKAKEDEYTAKLEALREDLKSKIPTTFDDTNKDEVKNTIAPPDVLEWIKGDGVALDDDLVTFQLLYTGTPRGFAEAELDEATTALVEEVLSPSSLPLIKQMLVADAGVVGPFGWNRSPPFPWWIALKIYKDIQAARKVEAGKYKVLDEMVIAVAVEHTTPIVQNDASTWDAGKDAKHVDSVARFLHYETAFVEGELDDDFHLLDAWSLRHVVNGDEPNEIAAWGRRMLRNFRPDRTDRPPHNRYVSIVQTDIGYGTTGNDSPNLQFYQNILMNAGICGRRSWFGRFILRAFGIPTTARPSRGHASLAMWTAGSRGWVVHLGARFGVGWTKTPYVQCIGFKETADTRYRAGPDGYTMVLRGRWIGDLMGEKPLLSHKDSETPKNVGQLGLWYSASLALQDELMTSQALVYTEDSCPATPPCPIDCQISKIIAHKMDRSYIREHTQVTYQEDGTIIVPAAGYTNTPTDDAQARSIIRMLSYQQPPTNQLQLFCTRFNPTGKSLLRGGEFKNGPATCSSGSRMKSDGKGYYMGWGFRIASSDLNGKDENPDPTKTIELDPDSGITLEMVYIAPGTFIMGGVNEPDEDVGFAVKETPKHEVEITKGYYLGKYPVTQEQYECMMGINPTALQRKGLGNVNPKVPVDLVSDGQCMDFCSKVSEVTGVEIRLPTEAEWEHAARCGTETMWFFGDKVEDGPLSDYAWVLADGDDISNYPKTSFEVGQKKPNPWGLYDMYGNVWERVSDKYYRDYYANSPKQDPDGGSEGTSSDVEYTIKVEKPGKYTLTVECVTMNEYQRLMVAVNGDNVHLISLPFLLAEWGEASIVIELKEGENELHFWRDSPPQFGVAIKNFILKPGATGEAGDVCDAAGTAAAPAAAADSPVVSEEKASDGSEPTTDDGNDDQSAYRMEFDTLDRSKTGFIEQEDLSELFRGHLPPKVLDNIMKVLDPDKDGKISFEEYLKVRKHLKAIKKIPGFLLKSEKYWKTFTKK